MKRFFLLLGVLYGLAALPSLALADDIFADADGVVPLVDGDLNFGDVCANTTVTRNVLIVALKTTGAGWANGVLVSISVAGVSPSPGPLSAAMNADAGVTLPGNWVSQGAGTLSSDSASSTVGFSAPGAPGPFSGSVTYAAAGTKYPVFPPGIYNASDVMGVTANVVNCGPVITDTTPPVTTKAVGLPKYGAGDKYVSGSSTFTLTCNDSGGCAGTFYKALPGMNQVCPSNTLVNEGLWSPYVSPFTLTGSDGDYTVCFYSKDSAGNREAPKSQNHYLDNTAPIITITTPAATGYVLGQVVNANFGCLDAGSGVSTCAGTVANGAAIDTATLGSKNFMVSSTDHLGNASAKAMTYSVVYKVCGLFDQTKPHQAGSTVPIRVQLCDMNGNNLSSPSIVVTAFSLSKMGSGTTSSVEDSGRANPGQTFRYDASGYIFNLSTKSPSPAHGTTTALEPGTWQLGFMASTTGNQVYYVQFDVK